MAQPAEFTKPEVERRRAAAERARGMLDRDPSRSFSDELIADRRAEARAEDCAEDLAAWRIVGRTKPLWAIWTHEPYNLDT